MLSNVKADLRRYTRNGVLELWEPSLWAILSYRFGRWARRWHPRWLRLLGIAIDAPIYLILMLVTGIHLPRRAEIGPGLRIWHFGGVFINPLAKLGANCTLRQNVCIGTRRTENDVPVVGSNVEFGVGAVALGRIEIGDHATIGANAVVLCDVPALHVAVGNPAVVRQRRESEIQRWRCSE